jgi:hypothetical protein
MTRNRKRLAALEKAVYEIFGPPESPEERRARWTRLVVISYYLGGLRVGEDIYEACARALNFQTGRELMAEPMIDLSSYEKRCADANRRLFSQIVREGYCDPRPITASVP